MNAGRTLTPIEQAAADRELVNAARGVVDVNRAVDRFEAFQRGEIRPIHVNPSYVEQTGWPACSCGRGAIRPGAVVTWRGRKWHVVCALFEMRAASVSPIVVEAVRGLAA